MVKMVRRVAWGRSCEGTEYLFCSTPAALRNLHMRCMEILVAKIKMSLLSVGEVGVISKVSNQT